MLAWLILLLLVITEGVGFAWWLRKEYYPVIFNGWAVLIYSSVLAADFIVTWLASFLFVPGGSTAAGLLALLGALVVVVVLAMTIFFRWVVRHDMTDIPK